VTPNRAKGLAPTILSVLSISTIAAILVVGHGCSDPQGQGPKPAPLPDLSGTTVQVDGIAREPAPVPNDWKRIELGPSGAAVAMPAQHGRTHTVVGRDRTPMETLQATTTDGAVLLLTHGPLPPDAEARPPELRLEEMVGGFLDQNPGTLSDRRRGRFSGRPSIDFLQTSEGGSVRARALIDGSHAYMLIAREPVSGPTSAADSFFSSLQLSIP
jgi:hypothetical protein